MLSLILTIIIPSNYKVHDGEAWRTVGIPRIFDRNIDLGNNRIENLGQPATPDDAATLEVVEKLNTLLRNEFSKDFARINEVIQELREAQPGGVQAPEASDSVPSGYGVGDIRQSILSETIFRSSLSPAEAKTWVICDGRNVSGSDYERLTGESEVPDLRGAYLRMAGTNETITDREGKPWDGGSINTAYQYLTGAPQSQFVTDNAGNHNRVGDGTHSLSAEGVYEIENVGGHTHIISGGDKETRPPTYTVNYFVKVDK